jgi:hypothetical protein
MDGSGINTDCPSERRLESQWDRVLLRVREFEFLLECLNERLCTVGHIQ